MFKKLLGLFIFLTLSTSSFAVETKYLPYKNIKEGQKINITEQGWTDKIKRKDMSGYIKTGQELLSADNSVVFETGCDYLFINGGKLYGYSEKDLSFYEFLFQESSFTEIKLNIDEVSVLFEDFRIISTSEFSKSTNVFRLKKKRGEEKIMILNDTDGDFSNFVYTSNKAKFNCYNINNAIGVTKGGLIQFSRDGESFGNDRWFIILVR